PCGAGNLPGYEQSPCRAAIEGLTVIDFRYHLVSIVAVFLALAIGIVLGSTELQGSTLDVLRAENNSLTNKLNDANAQSASFAKAAGASDTFLLTAEPKLLSAMLTGM